ncbi:MAG: hypothetical protein ACP5PQ_05855 [Thermoproteota archaeon]
MAENGGEVDRIVEILLSESALTPKQLKALLLYSENMDQKIVEEGYVEFDGKKVSKGAFFRTLNQAKTNVRRAVITLIIMSYIGLMDANQLDAIMQLNNIIMQLKEQDENTVEELVSAFIEKLKTVIDLRKRVK